MYSPNSKVLGSDLKVRPQFLPLGYACYSYPYIKNE